MTQLLLEAIWSLTDKDRVEEADKYIKELIDTDKIGYIANLVEILNSDDQNASVKRNTLLLLYKMYPEDIAQQNGEFDESDMIPQEITSKIIEITFALLGNPDESLRNNAIHLYARAVSYYINLHDIEPFHALIQTLMELPDANLATTYTSALCEILISYYPEEAETHHLFRLVFVMFNTQDIQMHFNAIKIVNSMVENISDFFEPADEDAAEENQQIVIGIASALLQYSQPGDLQCEAFKCWDKIGKQAPIILAENEPILIEHALGAMENSEDRNLLFAACALIKRIAKIEIEDETEQLNGIEQNIQNVLTMLMDVCSSVDDPSCETNETWEPYIAAYEAMKTVCKLTADTIAEGMSENFSEILNSNSITFSERDCWLRLLECVIVNTTNKEYVKQYFQPLISLASDESPCIRFRALKCIRKGLEFISEINRNDEYLIELSKEVENLANILDDDGHIASEVCFILSLFTKVTNYERTSDILQLLTEKAVSVHQHFAKEPFDAIERIVTEADEAQVLNFFPNICGYLESALNQENFGWLVHDLGELVQAYAFRFKEQISPVVDHLCNLFLQVCNSNSEYLPEVLLPFTSLCAANHEIFGKYLPNALEIFENIVKESSFYQAQSSEHSAFYCVVTGFSIILLENYPIENIQNWLEILATSLSVENNLVENMCAAVLCIDSIAIKYSEMYSNFAKTVLGYIRTYCQELSLKYGSDGNDSEGQNLAKCISQILLTTYKIIGPENIDQENLEMTGELFLYFCEQESITSDFMYNVLSLMEFIGQNFHDFMAELISNNPDLQVKLENAKEYYDNCEKLVASISTMFADLFE
ncbi:hypothetical protein TVAG_380270 [Trichomonas vaginalis G3]|uniref:Importin N-terminal domain-containing protein n=1 Tax=Trichomonas vaginalis (strain ATCC PRA-98 / G3) TaxID=412133 RepID=A2DXG5_TRIV3|nr:armadillo (ARM) repeat-containing protein family [Trichomonas vaginalis G3]EAY14917.1 hypothetical protein TVAG_380270 [Trichomonas vaginalis G3]KAI5485415.1 armadillo (ARM) repeat-containing protein family [Trichomonas vaginalis G3]|eukprot:XP_001327140.1 hypothetical protein [Trichomonas vaginalis G3]